MGCIEPVPDSRPTNPILIPLARLYTVTNHSKTTPEKLDQVSFAKLADAEAALEPEGIMWGRGDLPDAGKLR